MKRSTGLHVVAAICAVAAMTPHKALAQKDEWYKDSTAYYEQLKKAAGGGTKMTWDKLPDWKGLWNRVGGTNFDSKAKPYVFTTAKLTPEYKVKFEKKLDDDRKGLEWDYITYCLYPGYPRWLTEPLLKEFTLTPEQDVLVNEGYSDIRRIYTAGEKHPPEDEAYPLINGDSIGFWDKDTLIIHTTQVRGGDYNRGQPDFTEQASTVEKWRKVDPETIQVDVTVWDPPVLAEPWHTVMEYKRDHTPNLRMRIWSCEENNNVYRDPKTGASNFVLSGEQGYKDPDQILTAAPGQVSDKPPAASPPAAKK